MSFDETYLDSDDFKSLCRVLDFLDEDMDEIKRKVNDLEDKSNLEASTAVIIYEQMLKYMEIPSREIIPRAGIDRKYFCQFYIRNPEKWADVANKIKAGIRCGKINSQYLVEKEFNQELDSIRTSKTEDAFITIYLHEIHYLCEKLRNYDSDYNVVLKHALSGLNANPLYFRDVKKVFEQCLETVANERFRQIKDMSIWWDTYVIVNDERLASFVDDMLRKTDNDYPEGFADQMLIKVPFVNTQKVFYVISCGSNDSFKSRSNPSDIICIKYDLIKNSPAISLGFSLPEQFRDFEFGGFNQYYSRLDAGSSKNIGEFNVEKTRFHDKTFHMVGSKEYDSNDLFEIASQRQLSAEFLALISSLNLTVDDALEIRKDLQSGNDVLLMLNDRIEQSGEILFEDELLAKLERLYIKAILLFKYDRWEEIKRDLENGIRAGEIKSSYDLHNSFDRIAKSSFRANILYAQIEALLDFRELDFEYGENLAFYLQDKDILDNGLAEHLNELTKPPKIRQKTYLDEGKYPAPRWLVYPELDAWTIGWRMGYGEVYVMNAPPVPLELFPKPRNWLFNPRKSNLERIPLLGYLWTPDGRPKYCEISEDGVEVNDFITVERIDSKFQYNSFMLQSIENGILLSKYSLFGKVSNPHKASLNTLKRGFELTDEQNACWQKVKYSVLLNASYYKFMQDEKLRQKLLDTGNRPLVYVSDDEWGGEDNLFGFALMELRDEIRRLYENEDLIDWQYTAYLKVKDPYENPQKRDPNDEQSAEYMVILSTVDSSEAYVRDANLDDGMVDRYEVGQTITERGFVDATNRIGGIKTTHRYLILSNQMKDFSSFEKDTNWGLHVGKPKSKFKVLDICRKKGKTQILLLQLPEGFEGVFDMKSNLIKEAIESSRVLFDECLGMDPIAEVSSAEWLERVSFPLGMDDDGNFF